MRSDGAAAVLKFAKTRGRQGGFDSELPARPGAAAHGPPDVATNLRQLRQQQGYSLETLARLSGVSRAMLGQIETGKSAPTVTLLWKVAKALGVDLAELIAAPRSSPSTIVRNTKLRTSFLSGGRCKIRVFTPPGGAAAYEACDIELAPHHREDFAALPKGTHATLIVSTGSIEARIADQPCEFLDCGDAILFSADLAHSLSNEGDELARAYLIYSSVRISSLK